jgi:glycosyltransferase involved in cell wall biosynthesis
LSRSILLVSYFFPPTRDTGAQRPAAMAKHLARLGHRVTVLTTSAFGSDPDEDAEGVRVVRSADLQRVRARLGGHDRIESLFDADTYSGRPHPLSYAVVPEPLRLAWVPFARRAARRLHRAGRFDAVLTTSPPESAHLIGHDLRRRGLPWVADVRDAWSFEPLRPRFPLGLQRRADERMERRLLGAADRVVCVSAPVAEDLRRRGIADPRLIANAWDPDSDPSPEAVEGTRGLLDTARVSLLYTGRFGSYGRDPRPLASALRSLAAADPSVAGRLELAIAGPLQPAERELFEGLDPVRVTLLGSLERERALALQRHADALLLLAQPTRSQLVNFKLFEYLAAGRPILGLVAGTEAGRLLGELGTGRVVAADDEGAIASAIGGLVAGGLSPPPPDAAAGHSYPGAAERMAVVIEDAIGAAGS